MLGTFHRSVRRLGHLFTKKSQPSTIKFNEKDFTPIQSSAETSPLIDANRQLSHQRDEQKQKQQYRTRQKQKEKHVHIKAQHRHSKTKKKHTPPKNKCKRNTSLVRDRLQFHKLAGMVIVPEACSTFARNTDRPLRCVHGHTS